MPKNLIIAAVICAVFVQPVFAQNNEDQNSNQQQRTSNYPPTLPGSTVEVYKTVGDVKLNAYIYAPEGHQPSDSRPAIVFFFGGGWRSGTPGQFEQHCRYLASRGMVAITADYRVSSRHDVKAVNCVADAKSAIRWARANADRLGIDPNRIVSSGGSAGGHTAACTGVVPGFDEEGEDTSVSSVPNAMVLFNPAVVLASVPGRESRRDPAEMKERMGVDPEKLSPFHQLSAGAPPTLVIHGIADTTVPYWTAEAFAKRMKEVGTRCELAGYEGQAHGFFNFGRAGNENFRKTVRRADQFLVSLGYLEGADTVDQFLEQAE